MAACTILILTYKGRQHLEFLLPTLRTCIQHYKGDTVFDVLIVDNGCDAATRQFAETSFPEYRYSFSEANDFLFSLNTFIRDFSAEYTLLLNDDIRLDKEVLNELIPMMDAADESIFAISCKNLDWEGQQTTSAVRTGYYKKGWFYNHYLDFNETGTKYTLYPSGGSTIFRTRYFNELNGFDPLFRPAYYEDNDLGVRAWQNGWKTIYHPPAFVYHREGASMKDHFKRDRLEQNIYRNQVLCMMKNARHPGFIFWFCILFPYRLLYNLAVNRNYFFALLRVLREAPSVLLQRRKMRPLVKDAAWLPLLNTTYRPGKPIKN